MTGNATVPARTIGLLVRTWPKLSETFILEEILGLERHGLQLHIFALRRPTDTISQTAIGRVRAPVSYVPDRLTTLVPVVAAQLACFLQTPRRYLETLLFCLRLPERHRVRAFLRAACLGRELTRHGIGHLHVHFASEPADIAELASRLAGIPYSISAHAKDVYLSSPASLRRKLASARFTITCTEYNRAHLSGLAGPATTVRRMYHGVDLTRFQRSQAPPNRSEQTPLLLSVGRLREKKGFAVLIEACRLLRDAGTALRCQIVGYGEQHDTLQSLITRLGLHDTVQLAGKMTHEELIGLYGQATVFALPCQIAGDGDRDGIPNVLLEALAMEIAVVTTNVSGIPEVIEHGVNGLLVPPGDAKALACAIGLVLAKPDLRHRLGAAGRRTVADQFCNDTNLGTVRELLLSACQGESPPVNTPVHAEMTHAR